VPQPSDQLPVHTREQPGAQLSLVPRRAQPADRIGQAGLYHFVGFSLVGQHCHGVTPERWNRRLNAYEQSGHDGWRTPVSSTHFGLEQLLTLVSRISFPHGRRAWRAAALGFRNFARGQVVGVRLPGDPYKSCSMKV
jgi:hypothetical protein